MIPQTSSPANTEAPKPKKAGIGEPIPAGQEYVVVYVKRTIPSRYDGVAPILRGELLMMRRSIFPETSESFWLEDERRNMRGIINRDQIGTDVEVRHA